MGDIAYFVQSEYQRGRESIQPKDASDETIRRWLADFLANAFWARQRGKSSAYSFQRGSYDALVAWTEAHRPHILAEDD